MDFSGVLQIIKYKVYLIEIDKLIIFSLLFINAVILVSNLVEGKFSLIT